MASRTSEILRREKMDTALPTMIDLFVATKSTEGKSSKTTEWYRFMLLKFADFVGAEATIKDFTLNNARSFIAALQGRTERYSDHPLIPVKKGGLSAYTIHGYVRSLKVFAAWLLDEGFTNTNVLLKLKRPKLPETMIEVLTDEEIQRLIDCANPNCFLGARLHAIVHLLLDTGIRADELLTLTLDNCDLKGDKIKVTGKGDKDRIVPIGAATKKTLLRWLTSWRPQGCYHVFTNVDGEPLSYNGFSQVIRRLGIRAGVPRLHAHLFRHSFAVRFLVNGGDVMTLRLFLGHEDIQTTQMYIHLAESQLKVQHQRFSPIDNLKLKKRK